MREQEWVWRTSYHVADMTSGKGEEKGGGSGRKCPMLPGSFRKGAGQANELQSKEYLLSDSFAGERTT